ncbi:MAG: RluA family pseudouridine synthase [Verrucomicrobiota bacterium]|nr:RluA family pseudouridine synthase [Verrucomicrobiota bacterium]
MKTGPHTVTRLESGMPLVAFLAQRLRLSKKQAKALLDSRNVFVNGRRVWMAHHALETGDRVAAPLPPGPAARQSIPILFQDDHYLVADKPAGLLSNERDSVEVRLRAALGIRSLLAAHRLDRDTSGCLLFAKTVEALARALELFRERRIMKIYHAIVAGRVHPPERIVNTPIEGERAVTRLRVLDSSRLATHLGVKIDTGRTHQIRRHLQSIGHPVLGEKAYGAGVKLPAEFLEIPRQMLHARIVEFTHPFSGSRLRLEAPLPRDFRACLRRLKLT